MAKEKPLSVTISPGQSKRRKSLPNSPNAAAWLGELSCERPASPQQGVRPQLFPTRRFIITGAFDRHGPTAPFPVDWGMQLANRSTTMIGRVDRFDITNAVGAICVGPRPGTIGARMPKGSFAGPPLSTYAGNRVHAKTKRRLVIRMGTPHGSAAQPFRLANSLVGQR